MDAELVEGVAGKFREASRANLEVIKTSQFVSRSYEYELTSRTRQVPESRPTMAPLLVFSCPYLV